MNVYYNDNDPRCCEWLKELISANQLPAGRIERADIRGIDASTLPETCHFFAGIGGWPYALKLAGWPDHEPVWTGSCPCQPLSCAGQRKGHADERHLWPAFYRLISERKPATVFGEQIAGKDGREWFAGVRADLEGMGYAVGAADLCAAGVGAPHTRQRIYWVAVAGQKRTRRGLQEPRKGRGQNEKRTSNQFRGSSRFVGLVLSNGARRNTREQGTATMGHGSSAISTSGNGFWSEFDICHFTGPDAGKTRRVEPGTFPLAPRIPGDLVKLCSYGNAIVPQVAAKFIEAVMECIGVEKIA